MDGLARPLRRNELRNSMVGNNVDTEFLRLISGTHQIRIAFQRAGLMQGDERAWIVYLPEFGTEYPFSTDNEKLEIPRDTYNDADFGCKSIDASSKIQFSN